MGWMESDRGAGVARCSAAALGPVWLLRVMSVTFSFTSKGLEPFCFRRPRTTVQSDAVAELREIT